jgi:hypothetical protein
MPVAPIQHDVAPVHFLSGPREGDSMNRSIAIIGLTCTLFAGALADGAVASNASTGYGRNSARAAATQDVSAVQKLTSAASGPTSALREVTLPHLTNAGIAAALANYRANQYCGCQNVPYVKWVLKTLGVKSLSQKLLRKRLGKQVGDIAFTVLVVTVAKRAPKVRRVPFPDYRAKSVKKYPAGKTPYRTYEIFGLTRGPLPIQHLTWKYGITRQMIASERPGRQLRACTNHYGADYLYGGTCRWRWIWIGTGWFQARTVEAAYTLVYALNHKGRCPDGMPKCV